MRYQQNRASFLRDVFRLLSRGRVSTRSKPNMNVLVSLSNFPLKGQTNVIYTTELQRGKRWRGNVWFYSISGVKGKPLWEISVSRVSRRNTMKVISVSMNDNNKRLNSNQLKWSSSGKYETRNYTLDFRKDVIKLRYSTWWQILAHQVSFVFLFVIGYKSAGQMMSQRLDFLSNKQII